MRIGNRPRTELSTVDLRVCSSQSNVTLWVVVVGRRNVVIGRN